MKHHHHWRSAIQWTVGQLTFLTCLLFIGGCLTQPKPLLIPQQPFFLTGSFQNYQAFGRIKLVNQGETHSGEVEFSLTSNQELNLRLMTPLIGTTLYEIRADRDKFLVLDFQKNIYVLDDNIPFTRQQWMGVDISFTELGWVIWGRILTSQFEQWNGEVVSPVSYILRRQSEEITITLGKNGLLKHMTKTDNGIPVYEVQVSEYQQFETHLGGTSILPQRIQIYQKGSKDQLWLVMNEVTLTNSSVPLLLEPPPGMISYYE